IKNWGTSTAPPFTVIGKVIGPLGNNVVNTNATTDTLLSQESQDIIFSQALQPTTAGTYQYITNTSLTGDIVSTNNSKTQEIVAIDTTQSEMLLGFENGEVSGFGVGWVGGYGCISVHFIPPFYPVAITQLHYWTTSFYAGATFD